jgi:diaminopimelate decarboxylase
MTSLRWEGHRLRDVLATTGTPALVASEARLRENMRELLAGFRSRWPDTTLRYCAKTNPELAILRLVREEGLHVLTSHAAEARLAIAAGFAPEQIAYQRPILEERDFIDVLALGVRRVHAFRASDLEVLSRLAVARGCELRVSLRIALARSGMLVLSSASRRLGMDAREDIGKPRQGIVVDALNTYIGTQQERPEAFRPAVRELLRLAGVLRRNSHPIEEINLGGGVPSTSLRRVTVSRILSGRGVGAIEATSPRAYAEALASIVADEASRAALDFSPRLVLEPGRSIVGNGFILLTSIAAQQGRWWFLDCGRNVLVESPLGFTRWIAPVEQATGALARIHLSGPTLNTLDVIDTHRLLAPAAAGDVLAIGDAGAYTIARTTRYAGLSPAIWLQQLDGRLTRIRRAETFDDFTAPMIGDSSA